MAKPSAKKDLVSEAGFTRVSMLAGIDLGEHDGLPITHSSGSITGLDGGFSETAELDKIHVPVGSKVIGLIVLDAKSHEYDKVTEGRGAKQVTLEEFIENTVYKGESVLLIDPDDVEELVTRHQARVTQARLEAAEAAKAARGEATLPGTGVAENEGATVHRMDGSTIPQPKPGEDGYFDAEADTTDAE